MHFQTGHIDTRKWRKKSNFILISSKDIAIQKQFCMTTVYYIFSDLARCSGSHEHGRIQIHFSKVYLGCTLSQLNHMVSKERWNRGRGLKLLQKAIPSLPICMKEHFWHHTVGNIWQWQLSQWISKQGLSQSVHLYIFFSKQLWLLLLKLQGLKVGKIFNLHSGKTNMWVATL